MEVGNKESVVNFTDLSVGTKIKQKGNENTNIWILTSDFSKLSDGEFGYFAEEVGIGNEKTITYDELLESYDIVETAQTQKEYDDFENCDMDKKDVYYQVEMLQRNIDSMMVSDDIIEIGNMYYYANLRMASIFKANMLRYFENKQIPEKEI